MNDQLIERERASSRSADSDKAVACSRAEIAVAVCLTAAIAACGLGLSQLQPFQRLNPAVISMAIGIVVSVTFTVDRRLSRGMSIVTKGVLRLAIVVLGLQINVVQLVSVGLAGIAIVVLAVVGCFLFTLAVGKVLKVDQKLTGLIAIGTAICGASAILAGNAVSRAKEEDVAYALSAITLLGTIAMFLYPTLAELLGLTSTQYGLWAGASIHEVAQVMVAGYQFDQASGEAAVLSKLARVLLLAPAVFALSAVTDKREDEATSVPVPWFIVVFIGVVGLASVFPIPPEVVSTSRWITTFLLAMVLGGIGATVSARIILRRGIAPLILAVLSAFAISLMSLVLAAVLV